MLSLKSKSVREITILVVLLLLFTLAYKHNISGWLIADDEGTDLYEVWRLHKGEHPGVDYVAAQLPFYLRVGELVMEAAGPSVAPMRLLSAIQVLAGAFILTLIVRKMWGLRTAVLTLGLILTSGMFFEQARLFRPDPMMLAWEMVGLGLALYAVHTKQRRWWALSGVAYAIASLLKLFGVIPLLGLIFYFAHQLWRRRTQWKDIILDGLAFALPFILVILTISAILFVPTKAYYMESFRQHASLGQGSSVLARFRLILAYYGSLFLVNGVFIFWLPLRLLNRHQAQSGIPPIRLLMWQFVAPLIFLAVTRPIYLRYFIFLIPVLALLLAYQINLTYEKLRTDHPFLPRAVPIIIFGALVFAAAVTVPRLQNLLLRHEQDTQALAEYVAAQTDPDDLVLSDYAMINFLADRGSIYEATNIAGGRIRGGFVTADMLIDRMETEPVKMVLIHVPGGRKIPDHLYYLHDYDQFRDYLQEEFGLLREFDRRGQRIEIYQRP